MYSEKNIQAFYRLICKNSSSILLDNKSYSAILTKGFCWPNTIFGLSLEKDNKEAELKELKEKIQKGELPGMIRMAASSSQVLRDFLEANCIRKGAWTAMIMEQKIIPESQTEVEISVISLAKDILEWVSILEQTLMKGGKLEERLFLNLANNPAVTFFMAYVNGKAVAVALTFVENGEAGVYLVATRPEYRKKGIGKAISRRAVNDAFEKGAALASLQSTPMGRSVYEAIGFQDSGEVHVFLMHES